VRHAALAIAQTGLAAGIAWALARVIVGQPDPFFAPAAAVISLGISKGQSPRRAVELSLGVAIGIATADLLRQLIGVGPVQIGVIVALTMAAALFVGAGMLLINQAAISAVLVLTLPSSGQGAAPDRFFDALIGGAVAVAFSQVVFRHDPLAAIADAFEQARSRLEDSLRAIERALRAQSLPDAEQALTHVRSIDDQVTAIYAALREARDNEFLATPRRRAAGMLDSSADTARQLDFAVRDTRVLARSAAAMIRGNLTCNPELIAAIALLADAVGGIEPRRSNPDRVNEARQSAASAAERATGVLATHPDLYSTMLVGQVRAITVDVIRATGEPLDAARAMIRPITPEE
jgi:hypothetical protein